MGCSVDTSKLRDPDPTPSAGANAAPGGARSDTHEGGAAPSGGSAGVQGVAGSVGKGGAPNGGASADGGTSGAVSTGGSPVAGGSGGTTDACTATSKNVSAACDDCISAACGAQSYECNLEPECYDAAGVLDQCLCTTPSNMQCLSDFNVIDDATKALGTCVVTNCTHDCI